ncbi:MULTISPECIES: DUF4337 domain-containing protein [Acidithiobacillus]|jgi:hypothetical protein|uniref:DUF4337 domain-containing protein n=3 Tax=Acidithiobacillus TaxID=119977 RepID=A0A179BJ76_ACIFR|nr:MULTISPECIES: DUF4337 domain-containing protein [Acidithiobacillus]MDA8181305.1 DUF4337 domain-containing protein [Acidithiobacillus sp.]MBU2830007.1 DUF4337 domain-containing protein [Acidithiobacillus ferriphilus]MBU2831780.1 DUF4337 domain-containing protein [Acidithiobacillus ferriphilus]MBU2854480.1 DUF4337 domain-containing protein [Acidithiobacillus ferriphilus]MBW9248773.1 DUF4337 family protein [Acidithiobacillus ferriphilus]
MSESLHTHAPHEEAIHEAAEPATHKPTLGQWVAIFTALLATLGAVVGYQGTHLMNEVLLAKNEAVLEKAKATDQWNYYQAISTKEHLMQLAVDLTPAKQAAPYQKKILKYKAQKKSVQAEAQHLEQLSSAANGRSERLNRPHNDMAIAMIFLQIAISLASITALTGRIWLFGMAILSALSGVGLWVMALSLA